MCDGLTSNVSLFVMLLLNRIKIQTFNTRQNKDIIFKGKLHLINNISMSSYCFEVYTLSIVLKNLCGLLEMYADKRKKKLLQSPTLFAIVLVLMDHCK